MNRLPIDRQKKLIGFLTSPKHRTWSLNRIRLEMGEPLISWKTVRRYADKHDLYGPEREEGLDGYTSPARKPTSGPKYKSTILMGTFVDVVQFLSRESDSEARKLLRKLKKEDPRAYQEAIDGITP